MSGYTTQEVAQRAGVDPDYVDRLVEPGILTPAAADAFSPGDALRARWLQPIMSRAAFDPLLEFPPYGKGQRVAGWLVFDVPGRHGRLVLRNLWFHKVAVWTY